MICKSVVLNILCFKTPCCLTIISDNGHIIKKTTLKYISSKICFCTNSKSIKLIARYNCKTICKTIYLSTSRCQNSFANLLFDTNPFNQSVKIIILLDANYGFPISKAIINFKQLRLNFKTLR